MEQQLRRKAPFVMNRIHQPPPEGDYFELNPHSPRTPGTPEIRIDHESSTDQTPLHSPEPLSRDELRKSFSRLSTSETLGNTLHNFPHDIEIQSLIQQRSRMTSPWGLHWWTPFCMVGLFVIGIVGTAIHHGFYLSLNGKEAKNQLWMVRIGVGMAFLNKTCFVGCVVLSYKQRIWYSLRRRAMTVNAIDGLFAVIEDPSQFRKWEMLTGAKLAVLMAAAAWTIPIAAVFSPSTLTATLGARNYNGTCSKVPNLNFTAETDNNWRVARIVNGGLGISLSYFNTTDPAGKAPGFFDYYDQPSKNAERVTSISAFMERPVAKNDANIQACGAAGLNCTYAVSFKGPGYRCNELASGIGSNATELAAIGSPVNTSSLVPEGFNIYQAVVDIGDYAPVQTTTDDHGVPIPPYPSDLGDFKMEPVLYIGYSVDTGKPLNTTSPFARHWKTEHIPKIFSCTHHETEYNARFEFKGGQQQVTMTSRSFLSQVVDTTLPVVHGVQDPLNPAPESNWIRPNSDVEHYRLTAAYHSMGLLLRRQLQGTIDMQDSQPRTKTDASATRLVDQTNFYPVEDLQIQVQSFYEDMILSLLSDPHLIVGTTSSVPCTRSRRVSVFEYYPEGLWIGYAIVIFFTSIFLAVGFHAMHDNGVASDTVFSRIMTTTRNPTLDRLSVGACLGSDPFPKELERTKLRFGVLNEEGGKGSEWGDSSEVLDGGEVVGHCAFGTEPQVRDIIKGRAYAGLRGRWKGLD